MAFMTLWWLWTRCEIRDYSTNDDSKEKKLLGERWAKGSNGGALFLMAVKKDERGRNS